MNVFGSDVAFKLVELHSSVVQLVDKVPFPEGLEQHVTQNSLHSSILLELVQKWDDLVFVARSLLRLVE